MATSVASAVTKHDTNALPINPCTGLWVGGTGDVAVRMTRGGNTVVFVAVPAGTRLDGFEIDRVLSTGTTATSIIALGD